MSTFERTFTWNADRRALVAEVEAAGKEAVKALGGPVERENKFVSGSRDFIMTWKRKAE